MVKKQKKNAIKATVALVAAGVLVAGTQPWQALNVHAAANKYYTDYATYQDEQTAAEELLAQIGEEGMVLLKNKDNVLPFNSNVKNVTMFGAASVDPCYGGGGSGAANFSAYQTKITPQMALESAGFNVNPRMVNFYVNEYLPTHPKTATTNSEIKYSYQEPTPEELKVVEDSFSLYGDAAIIFKYGSGSEGTDKQRDEWDDGVVYSDAEKAKVADAITSPENDHTLEFTPREIELIKYAAQHFDKVVLVLNTGNAVEMSWIQDTDLVDAVIWAGNPGTSGFASLGKILNGTVSPSGHLADIYPANFTQDPSWFNYANNSGTTGESKVLDANGNEIEGMLSGRASSNEGMPEVEYEEGIYYGYRWYETAAADGSFAALAGEDVDLADYMPAGVTDTYYNRYNGVVYPFGYGLSYTEFTWTIKDSQTTITADGKISISVEVANIGKMAGKDVVQVYYTAPFVVNDGKAIEKAAVNLVAFAKTDELAPGQKQTIELQFDVKDMASFDYNDANGNGFSGYELEAGEYTISLRTDSHTVKGDCELKTTLASSIKYDGSTAALNWNGEGRENATAIFSQDDIYNSLGVTAAEGQAEIFEAVTRVGGLKMPSAPTKQTLVYSQETLDNITQFNVFNPLIDAQNSDDPWDHDIPEGWTQGEGVVGADGHYAIVAADMVGIDPEGTTAIVSDNAAIDGLTGKQAWEKFMNQFTLQELIDQMGCKAKANTNIDFGGVTAADGPAQLKGSPVGTYWCCETLIGTTWNVDLAYKQGVMVGNEGLFQNCLGWWGPGMNIHRSPFSGRNFEYYSQDGVHSGYMAAAVVAGAQSKGLVCYAKHFAVNDQETYRESNDGVLVWVSEQAMREIYFKPFEMIVKNSDCKGLMTSYNRIGAVSADLNSRLMQDLAIGEWGYTGNFVSDANAINTKWYDGGSTKSDVLSMRAGCVNLSNASNLNASWNDELRGGKGNVTFATRVIEGYTGTETELEDGNAYYAIRTVAQRFLYVNINSFALRNGIDSASAFGNAAIADAYANVSYSQTLGVKAADIGASYVSYEISEGALPAGLTLSADGTISGSATEKGTFSFTVKATADYVVTSTKSYTINVVTPFVVTEIEGNFSAMALDEEFDGQIEFVKADEYDPATYSVSGTLPEGLSFESDGTLYGTPTKAGVYTFTVTCRAVKGSGRNQQTLNVSETYTVTVEGEDAETSIYIGENGNWFINGQDTGVAATGPKGDTGAQGEAGPQGETGPQGEKGEKGDTGAPGADGASGCGSAVGGFVAMGAMLSVAAVACGAAALKRRKTDKN